MGNAPDFRRVATRVDFQDPCVLEDLDGKVLVYEPRAVIIHLGESRWQDTIVLTSSLQASHR